jgi:hypothetical protein
MTRLFTASERDESTQMLVAALRADARIDEVELFGSVAEGASLRLDLDDRHHKQADELPAEVRAALEPTRSIG